jgi:hypothetical protein
MNKSKCKPKIIRFEHKVKEKEDKIKKSFKNIPKGSFPKFFCLHCNSKGEKNADYYKLPESEGGAYIGYCKNCYKSEFRTTLHEVTNFDKRRNKATVECKKEIKKDLFSQEQKDILKETYEKFIVFEDLNEKEQRLITDVMNF